MARHAILEPVTWDFESEEKNSLGEKMKVNIEGQGPWAVTDTLDAVITVDGTKYRIPPPDLYNAHLRAPSTGVRGNALLSGVTIISMSHGQLNLETFKWSGPKEWAIEPLNMKGLAGPAHSEFEFFLGWTEMVIRNLGQEGVLGVVFEAWQTNTPCASCQMLIGSLVTGLMQRFPTKAVVFRGRAKQIYESAPGKLGTAIHSVNLGMKKLDQEGPVDLHSVIGMHLTTLG